MLPYKKILVPIDFSPISRTATEKAKELRELVAGELFLVHIIDYVPPPYVGVEVPAVFASKELMSERAEQHLDTFVEQLNVGACRKIVQVGKARKALSKIVEDNQIDLVIMAKHNESGLGRVLGSTTHHMVSQLDCDVLVIHGS